VHTRPPSPASPETGDRFSSVTTTTSEKDVEIAATIPHEVALPVTPAQVAACPHRRSPFPFPTHPLPGGHNNDTFMSEADSANSVWALRHRQHRQTHNV
jgi:hypothetical protein